MKKRKKEMFGKNQLSLRFMTYKDLERMDSNKMIKEILDEVIENKIVVLQGKLKPVEEASLIQSTMALIGRVKGFKGVELATIQQDDKPDFFEKMRVKIAQLLIGDRDALTIIGPATVVKEIRKDPKKIDLFLKR